jgi:hypothetical protein
MIRNIITEMADFITAPTVKQIGQPTAPNPPELRKCTYRLLYEGADGEG